jgi:hypothetical protein
MVQLLFARARDKIFVQPSSLVNAFVCVQGGHFHMGFKYILSGTKQKKITVFCRGKKKGLFKGVSLDCKCIWFPFVY